MRATILIAITGMRLLGPSGGPVFGQPSPPRVTKDLEASALAFAREHHRELAELLGRLKSADRAAYDKAVAELSQASERLARLKENDAERYQLSLEIWTLDSRIRLLAARMTMASDPGIEGEIRDLLRDRQRVRLALLRLDRERFATRLERVDAQISQLENNSSAAIENDFARIQREVRNSANRERRANRKAEARQSEKQQLGNRQTGKQKPGKTSGAEKASKRDDR